MIHYFTPYSLDAHLFDAYEKYADLVKDPEAWLCFLDGDSCFLTPKWGHVLEGYIKTHPDMGMFTSYVSRAAYTSAIPRQGDRENPDIGFHRKVAMLLLKKHGEKFSIKPYNRNVSGHLMLIKVKTWLEIREDVAQRVSRTKKRILGVDTQISKAILAKGLKIGLMRAVYCLHYFRFLEKGSKKHLL